MFGYIYVNEQELKLKEYAEYRGFYCGLCHNLHIRYGRIAQLMLNYDLTFLAILLTGLYEPPEKIPRRRCILHPVTKHMCVENEAVRYAADMCVMLSWQKLADDWRDERKYPQFAMAAVLKKDYARLRRKYPRQAKALERNIRLLSEAEKSGRKDIDYVAGLTGNFLAEIFAWKEDEWQDDLRAMGFYLGKFVYLMDALEDIEKDRKKGNYNLFSDFRDIWEESAERKTRELLTEMMAEASRAFERLPVIAHASIIRNVLYSGVWCRYAAMRGKAAERAGKSGDKKHGESSAGGWKCGKDRSGPDVCQRKETGSGLCQERMR